MFVKDGSLRKWKHDIADLVDADIAAEKLYDVQVRQFVYNDDYLAEGDPRIGKTLPGFIADEIEETYPVAAAYDDAGKLENWDVRMIVPGMLKLIQQQKALIDDLTARIEKLEGGAE